MVIDRYIFDSDNLKYGIYDKESETLYIGFRGNDRIYSYQGVSQSTWEELKEARSSGSYFHRNIRGGDYEELTEIDN